MTEQQTKAVTEFMTLVHDIGLRPGDRIAFSCEHTTGEMTADFLGVLFRDNDRFVAVQVDGDPKGKLVRPSELRGLRKLEPAR